jgi:dehydrogenase/reductase SDR family protein 7
MMFLPPLRQALTAAAATSAVAFLFMDANPSLWVFDKFLASPERFEKEFGGKRIWITGASSGIGAELALQLASCDAQVILSGRSEERLQQVASKCGGGSRTVVMNVDCSEEEMNEIVEQVGPVDCVILNAGIGQQLPATKTSRKETEELFRINALAPIHLTQTLLKQPKPPSQVVVTSSVGAKFGVPLSASYAASKHATIGYFSSLAAEQPHLKISLPCPGPVATPFFGTQLSKRERKMEASRCARLIISTMLLGGETWIAQQPTLFFCYLNQYLPGVANFCLQRALGPTRIALWEAGLNVYDPASIGKLRKLQKQEKDRNE